VSQQALPMPDGLKPPFYTVVYRYGTQIREEWDELSHAFSYLAGGEDHGEHSVSELGDAEGWLWRRGDRSLLDRRGPFEASERAPKRGEYFYEEEA
jgi:hypothetical protein